MSGSCVHWPSSTEPRARARPGSGDGAVRLLAERPLRLVHLRMDLSGFEPMFIPDIKPALPHALGIADQIRRYRVERPADLLGVMYVWKDPASAT